jgi:hypothetical protein
MELVNYWNCFPLMISLIIYGLFNDVTGRSVCIASIIEWIINNELKWRRRKRLWYKLGKYPGICPGDWRKPIPEIGYLLSLSGPGFRSESFRTRVSVTFCSVAFICMLNITDLWDATHCNMVDVYRHFEGKFCIHLQVKSLYLYLEIVYFI